MGSILKLIGLLVLVGFATGIFNLENETVSLNKERATEVTSQARQIVEKMVSSANTLSE